MNRRARRAGGLTLVEMLVVLVIVGLTASLVIEGIGQGLGLMRRVGADQGDLYRELMGFGWVSQLVSAAAPNAQAQDGFEGNAGRLRLHTFRPLLGPEGVESVVELELDREGKLLYREGDQSMTLPLAGPVRAFAYQDATDRWYPKWPQDDERWLPERVRIEFDDGNTLDIGVQTQRQPFVNNDDMLFERD